MKAKTILGLDIKPNAMQLIKLHQQKNKFYIDWFLETQLPNHVFEADKISNFDEVERTLSNLVTLADCKQTAVAIAMPSVLVNLQYMIMPRGMHKEAITTEIHRFMQKEMNTMPETLAIDYVVRPDPQSSYNQICFAATHQIYLSQYLTCIQNAGLKVKIVDIDIYAFIRVLIYEIPTLKKTFQHCLIFYVTQDAMQLIVFDAVRICFYQQTDIENGIEMAFEFLIQAYHGVYAKMMIDEVIVCADKFIIQALHEIAAPFCASVHLVSDLVLINKNKKQQTVLANSLNFITTLGLAMRELPPW